MKTTLLVAASALAVVSLCAPATAQQMNMPGMQMSMQVKKTLAKKNPVKKTARRKGARTKKRAAKKLAPHAPAAKSKAASPNARQLSSEGMTMRMGRETMPMPAQPAPTGQAPMMMPMNQPRTGNGQMGQMPMGGMQHGASRMKMKAAFGPYPEQRDSSGTAWQPDGSRPMNGPMVMSGDWMLMAHGTVNLVYDHQAGPRGGDKTFVSGMLMGMAQHPLGDGTLQFRAMSPPTR